MRKTKHRLELFSFYDHRGIAAHLENQARQGWLLEKIGTWSWKYRRIEPKYVKFYVTYFPKASAYDPGPSVQEQTFQAYCEEAGWQLAASNAQIQIFSCEAPDPVPIETDAVLQVENIHAAAKRSSLLSHWILGGLGLMQMILWLISFLENPIGVLSDYARLLNALCWSIVIALCCVELISYYWWHKKAVEAAEAYGILYPTRSHRTFQTVCLLLVIGCFLGYIASIQSRRMMILLLLSYGYITLLILLVNGCRLLLKKLRVSANTNRVVTILVDVLLAFGMIGLITWGVMKMDLQDRRPVDTYEYHGRMREVYADELPVTVEALLDVDPAGYSKELTVSETFIAAVVDGSQTERGDWDQHLPEMGYRLAISRIPAWTTWFWESWMEDYPRLGGDMLTAVDPAPWKAEEAYREFYGAEFGYTWLIRWEDRFVRLTAYWELTEEQMGLIADGLLNCAE